MPWLGAHIGVYPSKPELDELGTPVKVLGVPGITHFRLVKLAEGAACILVGHDLQRFVCPKAHERIWLLGVDQFRLEGGDNDRSADSHLASLDQGNI